MRGSIPVSDDGIFGRPTLGVVTSAVCAIVSGANEIGGRYGDNTAERAVEKRKKQ